MANWEKTPGLTQDLLKGLYLLAGLRMPRNSPGSAGGSCPGKGRLVCPVMLAASMTRTQINGKKMNVWMDKTISIVYLGRKTRGEKNRFSS